MNNTRGSLWGIWDLHVHTPESIVQHYGPKNNEQTWEKFLKNIEALPESISVLGINDYIFLDGYKRILEEQKNGRLQNIKLFLPVIELRLDKFGGTASKLKEVNLHIIFSNELDPETIQQQFINALSSHYILTPEYEGYKNEWKGVVTKASLEELGKKIIDSVPDEEKHRFKGAAVEGFNNLCLRLDDIKDILARPYFQNKHIIAVGKTEWWDIKWNDQAIADKKTIINYADLVFTASENLSTFEKAKSGLKGAKVNSSLLDCSDAHWPSASSEKDRLGNCLTWIRADTTFNGLKQVLVEFDERVFIGKEPNQLANIKQNKTKYIKSLSINKTKDGNNKFKETWFKSDISINTGLVSIIGNKGSGKSALGDILGLLGNSKQQEVFSFLNSDKFKKSPENKAQWYEAKLEWESEETSLKTLNATIDKNSVERIKYIPQDYFERICNQIGGLEDTEFDKELKSVIFSHVNISERLDKKSLEELIEYKSKEVKDAITAAKKSLGKTNAQIVDIEKKITIEYKSGLTKQLEAKENELKVLERSKPKPVKKPKKVNSSSNSLKTAEKNLEVIQEEITVSEEIKQDLAKKIAKIKKLETKIDNFENELASFLDDISEDISVLQLDPTQIIQVNIERKPLTDLLGILEKDKTKIDIKLDKKNDRGLYARLESTKVAIKTHQEQLDKPSKNYQSYQEDLKSWSTRVKEIQGDIKKLGTIAYLRNEIKELAKLPSELNNLQIKRFEATKKIYQLILKEQKILKEFYAPVQDFITEHPDIGKKIELNFDVLIMNLGFEESFLSFLNLNKAKSFSGSEGNEILAKAINENNYGEEHGIKSFIEKIDNYLHYLRGKKTERLNPLEQLKKGKRLEDLYDFIYGLDYLRVKYALKLGEKELQQLSPGERGALLIVFYLLVDLDIKPLIIDQPEHNLDNETVTRLLVPAIKKAKMRRQIIMITHNPILAVVCNSDQVIVASLDIKRNYSIEYISGAIENPIINKKIVDVLEGTMPAFDNRKRKYLHELIG